ncbi:MAG: Holliday junction DNA helicase RuvA [Rhizobiales bacterium 65-79]|jgi:putative Holliday junction resolvase|nr:Holliday junction resolvase RuvX [Hyphomicrobiales bacterium]OJU04920.1 MAG: Holliday junction DNA helicase RuvA [Rhizobiales bacterium 65-79]
MPLLPVDELLRELPPGRTLAGIDLGTKTIGLAVSDRSLAFAHPRPVIIRKKFSLDAEKLLAAVRGENAGGIVVGLPVNMDGSEGPRAQASRAFVRNMERLTDLPFAFWDERLSTVAADRALIEMDVSRKKRETRIDSAAAAFILQGVLDRLQALGRRAEPSA